MWIWARNMEEGTGSGSPICWALTLCNRLFFLAISSLLGQMWTEGLNDGVWGCEVKFLKGTYGLMRDVIFLMYLYMTPCPSGCPLRSLLSKPSPELPVPALSPQLGIVMLTPWCLSPCGVRGRGDGWGNRKGKQAEWTAMPGLEGSSKTAWGW